jgi:small conductance mechanosensitive channel
MTNELVFTAGEAVDAAGATPAGQFIAEGFQRETQTLDEAVGWVSTQGPVFAIRLLIAAGILVAGWWLIRLAVAAVERVLRRTPLAELMSSFVVNVCHKALWALLIVAAVSLLGVDVTAIVAGIGVAGFLLGIAFKDALGNLASGMMIALNQPFSAGDYVILGDPVGGIQGTVKRLTMTMSELETPDGRKVVVPNSVVWGAAITNFTALGRRRVDLTMSIAYASDIDRAKLALRSALLGMPEVLRDPAPVVEILSFADSAIVLACRPYCKAEDYWKVVFECNRRMLETLRAARIEIPFPQMDVHRR